MTGDSDLAESWDAAYARGDAATSWYEPQPAMSLRMLDEAGIFSSASVVDVGGGNSRLADTLLERGHTDVTVLDLSTIALHTAQARVSERGPSIQWVDGDVRAWRPGRTFDAWHDRAVLHFLTTEADRADSLKTLQSATQSGSIAVIATFAPDGPDQCSGLPIARYSAEQITDLLGASWTLIGDARDEHETPSGATQPFTWTSLRRVCPRAGQRLSSWPVLLRPGCGPARRVRHTPALPCRTCCSQNGCDPIPTADRSKSKPTTWSRSSRDSNPMGSRRRAPPQPAQMPPTLPRSEASHQCPVLRRDRPGVLQRRPNSAPSSGKWPISRAVGPAGRRRRSQDGAHEPESSTSRAQDHAGGAAFT